MTRRELCRLTAELCDTDENAEIQREYWNAVRSNDDEKLEWFAAFGEDVRHRLMNVHEYRLGLLFGFTEIKFGKYGWLAKVKWPRVERIELGVKHKLDKHFIGNYIDLACGPNLKWTYSVHKRSSGGSGSGYSPHVHWHRPFKSRHVALIAALDEIKKNAMESLKRYSKYQDKLNCDPVYLKKVLEKINETYPKKEEQLTLALA